MKEVSISVWLGRFCNNLLQVAAAILYARSNGKMFVQSLRHPIIRPFSLEPSANAKPRAITLPAFPRDDRYKSEFYDFTILEATALQPILKLIRPFLRMEVPMPLSSDTLVIHMRGGDILRPPAHRDYIQPPLAFYLDIIQTLPVTTPILIITEKEQSPCAIALAEKFPEQVIIRAGKPLAEDVAIILLAKRFVCNSRGTFGFTLALMSGSLKELFLPSYNVKDTVSGFNIGNILGFTIKRVDYVDYFDGENEIWSASPEQLEKMMAFNPL